jgi:hypothetical protein
MLNTTSRRIRRLCRLDVMDQISNYYTNVNKVIREHVSWTIREKIDLLLQDSMEEIVWNQLQTKTYQKILEDLSCK